MSTRYLWLIFILLIPVSGLSQGDNAVEGYQQAVAYINHNGYANTLSSHVSQKLFPVTVDSGNSIKEFTAAIQLDALRRARYHVNLESPEIKTAKKIQAHAEAIAEGRYKDCNKKIVYKNSYKEKTCHESHAFTFNCIKKLEVKVNEKSFDRTQIINLQLALHFNNFSKASVTGVPNSGVVKSIDFHLRDGGNPWSCSASYGLQINGILVGWYHGQCGHRLGDLNFTVYGLNIPFANAAITLSLVGGGLSGFARGTLSLSYKEIKRVPERHWHSSCTNLPLACVMATSRCLDDAPVKRIDGLDINESCWQQSEQYRCGVEDTGTCQALKDRGCLQIGSHCLNDQLGICSDYQENWSCPTTKRIGEGLQCGQAFYCMKGDCEKNIVQKNKEFGLSVSKLSALTASGQDIKKQELPPAIKLTDIRIFAGQVAECSKDAAGVDCCADTGWGKDIFGTCRESEKALGKAKERGVVVAAGGYCKHGEAGVCVDYRKRYCVFPNKVAYNVQRFGRQDQLHKDFGHGKNTDCSGLSPEELARINFDTINFSNIAISFEAKTNKPNFSDTAKRISQDIKSESDKKTPYFKRGFQDV